MFKRIGILLCFFSSFVFFALTSHAALLINTEDVPFIIGTRAEYTQNADMFAWLAFDSTATIWDLTTHPGQQTAVVNLLDPSSGIDPAPDTFPFAQLVELDTLGNGSVTWTYMSKDAFYLYGQGLDFFSTYRFIGNYQPDAQIYSFPMYLGGSWITAWTWTWLIDGWLPYSANEIHLKRIVAKGWVKTEITAGRYWPCLVIRDNYTFTDNFGSNDQRWLYEWVVAGRFGGGNGIAAALSTNGASKDFVIVDKMLRMKSLNIPGMDLTLPVFDSTTVWTDTNFSGPYPVSSIITDSDDAIGADSLFYRIDSGDFVGVGHDSTLGDKYFFSIPGVASSCTISYYLSATDSTSVVNGIDIWVTDPEAAPENNLITFVVSLTGVEEKVARSVQEKALSIHPNPFASTAQIDAIVEAGDGPAAIKIFDQAGRLVRTFDLDGASGKVQILWPGTDDSGASVPSGTYFVRIEPAPSGNLAKTCKVARIVR